MKNFTSLMALLLIMIITLHAQQKRIPQDYSTIQEAINAASKGDTIVVNSGTYYENINFNGKGITVMSKYAITKDVNYILNTVIDGSKPINSNVGSCVLFNHKEDSTSVLQGFTITHGTGTLLLKNAIEGGGIAMDTASSPTIKDNLIINNSSFARGGNAGGGGGGISVICAKPVIMNNVIMRNSSGYAAGIVFNWAGGTFRNNIVFQNYGAKSYGSGGVMLWGMAYNGYTTYVENNTIVGNFSELTEGGMIVQGDKRYVRNNIIYGNAQASGPEANITASRNLFTFNNTSSKIDGTGNNSMYPDFEESGFQLKSISPCVDAGSDSIVFKDIAGSAVSKGTNRNDMGAYGGPLAKLLMNFEYNNFYVTPGLSIAMKPGETQKRKFTIINQSSKSNTIDSIVFPKSIGNNSTIKNIKLRPVEMDTITVEFNSSKVQKITDTIRIYHAVAGINSPLKVVVVAKFDTIHKCKWNVYNGSIRPQATTPDIGIFTFASSGGNPTIMDTIVDPDIAGNKLFRLASANAATNKITLDLTSALATSSKATFLIRMRSEAPATYARNSDLDLTYGIKREKWYGTNSNNALKAEKCAITKTMADVKNWHIYRLVVDTLRPAQLFVDEESDSIPHAIWNGSATQTSPKGLKLVIGDGSTSMSYGAAIDWMIWTTDGAFLPAEGSPVPDTLCTGFYGDSTLSVIKINGTKINGFSPSQQTYNCMLSSKDIPVISCTTNHPKAVTTIVPTTTIPGTATITVIAENGKNKLTYTINFVGPLVPKAPVAKEATGITQPTFTANWDAIADVSGYRLDVATDTLFSSPVSGYLDKDVSNVVSFQVTGLAANTNYYYRIRAIGVGGTSANSNVISLKTLTATTIKSINSPFINIYINNNLIYVASESRINRLKIIDLNGRCLYENLIKASDASISIEGWNSGIYLFVIQTEKDSMVKKVSLTK